jgi:autotransporter-associated beta strand protein
VLGTGSDIFQLGGTGAATFDVSSLGPQYQGFGTFNKIGSSVWTLTGTSTYAGPVNVNGGTLAVNGDITSTSVTVNTGATLGGTNGIVGNAQINAGGIFAPGSGAPGSSITVAHDLTFQSGAIYLVQLNSATASFANVSDTAALAGTVRVVSPTSYTVSIQTIRS